MTFSSSLPTTYNTGNVRTGSGSSSVSVTMGNPSFSFALNATSLQTYVPTPNVTIGETISMLANVTVPYGIYNEYMV